MEEFKNLKLRYITIYVLVTCFALFCVLRLVDLQIVRGAEYKEQSEKRLIRAYPIKSPRGEIVDRYGRPLVTNKMGFYIQVQDMNLDDEELNDVIYKLINILNEDGTKYFDDFPIKNYPYSFEFENSDNIDESTKKWKVSKKLENYNTADEIMEYYRDHYNISSKYTPDDARNIIAIRYEMSANNFNIMTPYNFATDVSMNTVQKINEQSSTLPGVSVEIEPIREYTNGNLAAHILGRTGVIYEEEYNALKDKGYGMNDTIGKDGLEKILESYLKGKDGYKKVEQTREGNISQVLSTQPATPGNYAVLTIDSKLQALTEKALAENITAARAGKGKDAYCGAAVAVDIANGEVLAMASYPSYDISNYNKDYNTLIEDPKKPLFNRALNGTYAPGSTFKPLTAITALEEGVITPSTRIMDRGIYTYYAPSYQPACWVWNASHTTHGNINVSEAIGVSCNYFFYEVGRLSTIEKIDEYAKEFGLGEGTGIELPESKGILAGPDYRKKIDSVWYPGDTLQAAIGQSDNLFTPAQLVSYVSTVLNRGKRYSLHLVKEVKSYDTGEVVFKNNPLLISETSIKDQTFNAVKDGMGRVTDDGTARNVFKDFPIKVGGKTGTAQVSNGSDNELFVGFAPFDNPQIAVAVIIEHAASSSYPATVAREMFRSYLGMDEVEDAIAPKNELLQ